ncbi:MAG: rRNA (guanine527-N7)-methyltransferase [Candidatus Atribacteria bacterium]|nr:rRNA (guanine527-N7)-methyltransferase [Candidatus Atribacteria bacterium]
MEKIRDIILNGFQSISSFEMENDKLDKISKYLSLLSWWNQKFNLTGFKSKEAMAVDLVLDSYTVLATGEIRNGSQFLVDVGSGSGVPGIPLKIFFPELQLLLVDSNRKKCSFLEEVIRELNLSQSQIVWERAENLAQQENFRESFDLATTRALSALRIDLELVIPLLKVGGRAIFYKGTGYDVELKEARRALQILGCEVKNVYQVPIPFRDRKNFLVVIRKQKATSEKYPRSTKKIYKNPL